MPNTEKIITLHKKLLLIIILLNEKYNIMSRYDICQLFDIQTMVLLQYI